MFREVYLIMILSGTVIRYSPRRRLSPPLAPKRIVMTATAVVGLALAHASDARAQQRTSPRPDAEEIDETNPRKACPAIARILATGHPARLVPAANRYIILCNDQAPAALIGTANLHRSTLPLPV